MQVFLYALEVFHNYAIVVGIYKVSPVLIFRGSSDYVRLNIESKAAWLQAFLDWSK